MTETQQRTVVHFLIPGPYRPERKRQISRGKWTRRVDTPEAAEFKAKVALFASQSYRGEPLNEPLLATITWRRPKPASYRKHEDWPWKQPDFDNLCKAVMDGLTGIVIKSDAIIVEAHLKKEFGDRWEVSVTLEAICEEWPYGQP